MPTIPGLFGWYIVNVVSSCLGIIIIGGLWIHVGYHLYVQKDIRLPSWTKASHMSVFACYWWLCLINIFLRTDSVIPVGPGHLITCTFSYGCNYFSYILGRILLFFSFLARIDASLNGSSFAYEHRFLIALGVCFILVQVLLIAVISLIIHDYGGLMTKIPNTNFSFCSAGGFPTLPGIEVGAVIYILADCGLHIFLCYLFVRKLKEIVNSVQDTIQEKSNRQYTQLMQKQTILVCIQTFVSLTIWLGVIVNRVISLLIPIECIITMICAWLAFKFANRTWNATLKVVGFCCPNLMIPQKLAVTSPRSIGSGSSPSSPTNDEPFEKSSHTQVKSFSEIEVEA